MLRVKDMAETFVVTSFNDISKWYVSQVRCMSGIFHDVIAFNGDISKWNVSKVTDRSGMFK